MRCYQPRVMPVVVTDGAGRRLADPTIFSADGKVLYRGLRLRLFYFGEASGLESPPLILCGATRILDSGGLTDSTPTHGSGQS